jgi:hypothetical protein
MRAAPTENLLSPINSGVSIAMRGRSFSVQYNWRN